MKAGGEKMKTKYAIIGGDLRNIKLANLLAKEKNIVYTYGLEKAEEIKKIENITLCRNLEQAIKETEVIIGAIPFSKDKEHIFMPLSQNELDINNFMHKAQNKIVMAGGVDFKITLLAKEKKVEIIDLMEQEELAILNAITTAEGAIEIAMRNTEKMLHKSRVLILGFGRIGKVLAKKLEGLSTKVTCAVRKKEDFAWIEALGYQGISINTLGENLSQFDIIINTVPQLILTTERLHFVDKECLLIDLASKPGGMDQESAKKMGIKSIWALALPGKVAPITTAQFIKDTIERMLKEIKKEKGEYDK